MNNRNLAKETEIVAITNVFNPEAVEYNIYATNLPGYNSSAPQTGSRFGHPIYNEPDSLDYNPLSLEFVIDENFEVWKEIVKVGRQYLNDGLKEKNIILFIKDTHGKTLIKVVYTDCVPISVSDLDYSMDTDDELPLKVTVDFQYNGFDIIDEKDITLSYAETIEEIKLRHQ